jgi:tetratricopeptide (TPR) repeat protein
VSWAQGDVWRPYETMRGERTLEAVPVSILAGLEEHQDAQALAGAWLLSGDPGKARALLDTLAQGPDVCADLAAVALAQGHPQEARELAQRALATAPNHPRALWNRALAEQALGLDDAAARTFGEVAALHEPGWSEEAALRQRALQARGLHDAGAD